MLRSVVGAQAANMMLVQCRSDVPISLACSMWFGNSLDHGIIETASHMDLEGQASLQAIFPLSQHRPHIRSIFNFIGPRPTDGCATEK